MPQEFLKNADIRARFQKVGGEAVPQGMGGHALGQGRFASRFGDRSLIIFHQTVMAAHDAGRPRIFGQLPRWLQVPHARRTRVGPPAAHRLIPPDFNPPGRGGPRRTRARGLRLLPRFRRFPIIFRERARILFPPPSLNFPTVLKEPIDGVLPALLDPIGRCLGGNSLLQENAGLRNARRTQTPSANPPKPVNSDREFTEKE